MGPRMAGFPMSLTTTSMTRSRRRSKSFSLSSARGSDDASPDVVGLDTHTASLICRWSEPCSEFICPITRDVMLDPVVASDGYTYERAAIVLTIKEDGLSPLTRELLDGHLFPNRSLAKRICDQTQSFKQSTQGLKQVARSQSAPMVRPPTGKHEHPVLGASQILQPSAIPDMAMLVDALRNDRQLLSTLDDGKWTSFERHCAGQNAMDAKVFMSGLCQLVGRRKVSGRPASFHFLYVCSVQPPKPQTLADCGSYEDC